MNVKPLKPMPSIKNDADAEAFTANADLTQYDLSGFRPMRFEIARKDAALNMRIPFALMEAVKAKAQSNGVPCARYVRMLLEADIAGSQ
jgi:predicted DNA binding CopG/RHH family protein